MNGEFFLFTCVIWAVMQFEIGSLLSAVCPFTSFDVRQLVLPSTAKVRIHIGFGADHVSVRVGIGITSCLCPIHWDESQH